MDNKIFSNNRRGHWVMWLFTLFWNLFTIPLTFQLQDILQQAQREPLTYLALLFPLVGLGLIAVSARASWQWRRFGPTPLVMDPFPGSLGGHVGGYLDTRIDYDPARQFSVTLNCIYSYMSGSGKNRSRREDVKWQTVGICHCERGKTGTVIRFRFDVPGHLPASDTDRGSSYHLWRVTISAEMDGPDFSRSFDIPVSASGGIHSSIDIATENHPATVDAAMAGIDTVADIQAIPGGIEVWFPPLQRPALGVFLCLFGLLFGGIGAFVGISEGAIFLPFVFVLLGSCLAGAGAFYLGKALLVSITREGIRSRRFLFGLPLTTRRLAVENFSGFTIDQSGTLSSGGRTTVLYQLYARGRSDARFTVADRLQGRAEAELLKETFEAYLGRH